MSDLISRSVLIEALDGRYKEKKAIVPDNLAEGFVQVEKLIKEQPTVDAVEIVRCKDCDLLQDCKIGQYLGLEGFCSNAVFDNPELLKGE